MKLTEVYVLMGSTDSNCEVGYVWGVYSVENHAIAEKEKQIQSLGLNTELPRKLYFWIENWQLM